VSAVPTPSTLEDQPLGTEILARASALVAPALAAAVDRLSPELQPPVRHHMAGGGKRVRAALVLVSAAASGGWEATGIVGAVAIELVHNFSLLHDDIIDGDLDRRHRPTVWAEYGVGRAIVAGDALASLSTEILLEVPTAERVRAAATLAAATRAMIAGQAEDMAFETRRSVSVEECVAMAEGKTGALLSCASSLGAILAGAPEATVDALAAFGLHLGVAFQAVDDLLGIWGDPTRTGKPAGNDLVQKKQTLPVAVALARSGDGRAEFEELLATVTSGADVGRAARLIEEHGGRTEVADLAESHLGTALDALGSVELRPAPRAQLEDIARFVTERDR
jgi:geranylgeranyl diphosphate synthase type I